MMKSWALLLFPFLLSAQSPLTPSDSGKRPSRLLITNALIIDGSGTPPNGPRTLTIEGNRIVSITPGPARPNPADRVIDAKGKYLLPGLINGHAHIHDERAGWPMRQDYQFLTWLASGITSVRDVGSNFEKSLALRTQSDRNEIEAPRLFLYAVLGINPSPSPANEAALRNRVRQIKTSGADGLKFFEISNWAMRIMLDEAHKQGLRTAHHAAVAETNASHDIQYGTTSIEHWYGIPDAALPDGVQNFPPSFNHQYEVDRFRYAGHLFRQADPAKLALLLDAMVKANITWSPTLNIYEAARDLLRYQTQPFFKQYLHPALEQFFAPDPNNHGSFFLNWTSADEAAWRHNYRLWMDALRDFARRGGNVAIGEDAGFIYNLYGFGLIRALELHQEAGFHPLQVIQQVTVNNAKMLGKDADLGYLRPGYLADLILVDGNPLADFRILYPKTDGVPQSGKIEWTIKDGIPYHAPTLANRVRQIVAQDRAQPQPRRSTPSGQDEEAH
ncbi:MAG: amidohydrolase family protein [Bryobacter sp.]|jgi:imidazolonepropionase-like amidohydrolase|nr:amidohydrolase family protein [Bryobacter sp. CoA8 C33]